MQRKLMQSIIQFVKNHFEGLVWTSALVLLYFANPYAEQHFTICLFHQLGINWCPGCGLGRSITLLMHGNFYDSFKMHPLGSLAVVLLVYRIHQLFFKSKTQFRHG